MGGGTCVEIDLNRLAANAAAVRERVAPARVMPVVKADAYGHGAVPVARRLVGEGFDMLAVAQLQEAMELKDSGVDARILIFGRLWPDQLTPAAAAGFRITVFGEEDLRWLKRTAGGPVYVHVNVETGMGRVGLQPDRAPDFFNRLKQLKGCVWEGCYSHFATSDEADKTYAYQQLERFRKVLNATGAGNGRRPWIHMANSGAVLDIAESYFDAVRPGILIYGHYPSAETSRSVPVRQVMTFKTVVAHVRSLPAGHSVSYGRRWTAPAETRIAVLPVGYADGLRRALSNRGEVLIRGRRYPIVGAVTMDQTMVHVGHDPVQPGDEVLLWGETDQGCICVSEVADKIGTIPYEITCGVSRRVKRVYIAG